MKLRGEPQELRLNRSAPDTWKAMKCVSGVTPGGLPL